MIPFLSDNSAFPDIETASKEATINGLLCAGGSLTPERLITAYQLGIFPWYNKGEPVLWWSPDPRCIIECDHIHISRSMRRVIKKSTFDIRHNTDFKQVITACAEPRAHQEGTWILPEMVEAYCLLHQQGIAHSYECWMDDELVGGIYGIRIGQVFCGESMFSKKANASKAALIHIAQETDITIIDCQMPNDHLYSLGAECIPRQQFINILKEQTCSLTLNY